MLSDPMAQILTVKRVISKLPLPSRWVGICDAQRNASDINHKSQKLPEIFSRFLKNLQI